VHALVVFAPVLGAPIVHAPVLHFGLLPSLARPLDGGRTWRGHRWFGDNKTWRGALCMGGGVTLATLLLTRWPAFRDALPTDVRRAGALPYGLLLGLGVVVGELPNSFLKRRLGIASGTQRRSPSGWLFSALDQCDLVLGAWVTLAPIWVMELGEGLVVIAVVSAIHLVLNVAGYAIGARSAPI
jgi:hypothetical protein